MEIEAKFTVTNPETFGRLQAADHIAGLTLGPAKKTHVHDTYLDTTDRAILAAGYACRRREKGQSLLITLKSLGGVEGAIHRREELEISLPSAQPPSKWPDGLLRDWVRQVIGRSRLTTLFELQQARTVRQASAGERLVAELSLDDVLVSIKGKQQTYLELEVELLPDGTEEDLTAIVSCLKDEWDLQAEPRSKFARGLFLLEETLPGGIFLTPQERAACLQIAKGEDEFHGRRAQALLALDEGTFQEEVGQQVGRTSRTIRRWLAAFHVQRLSSFPAHVRHAIAPPLSPTPPPPPEPKKERPKDRLPKNVGLEPDDLMVEAARKTLSFHFQRMLKHEPGTRVGEDIEELHDMRVATRRMRAAFRLFADYLDMKELQPFVKGLRNTGRVLGAVRDLDVFWEKTQHYLDTLPPERQNDLEPLHVVWQAEREKKRAIMLEYLDGAAYREFKESFGEFLEKEGAGALPLFTKRDEPRPRRLSYVVPLLVHQRVAALRAYDGLVQAPSVPLERLHQLRIASKALRYTAEFLEEVLTPEDAAELIKQMKALQDHLGALQDAVVASTLLRDFLTWGTWGRSSDKKVAMPTEPIVAPGVANYLAARQVELKELLDTFPQTWAHFQGSDFTQLVAAALAAL
jgi:CHAD domain-containing protein/transposase-like protein